jgi:hypothetical protein
MDYEYKNVTVKREDVKKVLKAFKGDYVNFGIKFDRIFDEKIVYVSNGEYGKGRKIKYLEGV